MYEITVDEVMLVDTLKIFLNGMFVFIIASSLFLLIEPLLFSRLAEKLQKRRGLMRQIFPTLEKDIMFVDKFLLRHRKTTGMAMIVCSVISILLLVQTW